MSDFIHRVTKDGISLMFYPDERSITNAVGRYIPGIPRCGLTQDIFTHLLNTTESIYYEELPHIIRNLIKKTKKSSLEVYGPYVSAWTSGDFFLVKALVNSLIVYSFVENGIQPRHGVLFENRQAANQYIKDNGFTLK